jgi:WD40 repeat protein
VGRDLGERAVAFPPNLVVLTRICLCNVCSWHEIEEAQRHGPGQGVCIHTLRKHLREVSSVDMNRTGTLLLSSSKDNSNRVWDLRMMRPHLHLALRGHRNSTKNFIRCAP